MKVVLPIAALLAILIGTWAPGAPVPLFRNTPDDLEGAAAAAAAPPWAGVYDGASPVVFDPFTGWGVSDLQHGVRDREAAQTALVEVDPLDRYGVEVPAVRLVRAVAAPWDWRSYAEVRAQYADPGASADALAGVLADAMPDFGTVPVVTGAWWETAPLDAK